MLVRMGNGEGALVSRAVNPGRFVTFTCDYRDVTPATVLESTVAGETRQIAEIPERTRFYKRGEVLTFGSVNAARAFVKAINAAHAATGCCLGQAVCKIGRDS
jgi:hypothetical protein